MVLGLHVDLTRKLITAQNKFKMAFDEDDDIQMNINLSAGTFLPRKKPKLSKLDRVRIFHRGYD